MTAIKFYVFALSIIFALVSQVYLQKEDLYQNLNNKIDNAFNTESSSSNGLANNGAVLIDLNQNIFSANGDYFIIYLTFLYENK
jgi:hypothetical protein